MWEIEEKLVRVSFPHALARLWMGDFVFESRAVKALKIWVYLSFPYSY